MAWELDAYDPKQLSRSGGANATGLLTGRGLFNGESESSGPLVVSCRAAAGVLAVAGGLSAPADEWHACRKPLEILG